MSRLAVLLLLASCATTGRTIREDPPPGTLFEARTSHCLDRLAWSGPARRVAYANGSCECDLTYCGGTPREADDGDWNGVPLKDTGFGEGRWICGSVPGSRAADEVGCPLQQPQPGEECLPSFARMGVECLYRTETSVVRLSCPGGTWTVHPGRCNPNVP